MDHRALGRRGEQAVASLFVAQGFTILAQNARVGRLELDLVVRRRGLVVFCEVKTARAASVFGAHERLGAAQQQRLRRAAAQWLREHPGETAQELRFDAAFVTLGEAGDPRVSHYPGAF